MAHVRKKQFTQRIPAGAERLTIKGVACVRWPGRRRQWQIGVLLPEKPGRCRVESSKWYVTYRDSEGNERTVPGFTDRAATDALMARLVQTTERIEAGLLPPEAARPKLTLTELLTRWHKYLEGGAASKRGAQRQLQRARDVCEGVKATRPADLTPSRVREWIGERRAANAHRRKQFGEGTAVNYVGAVKSFTRWLALVEKAEPVDSLSALKRPRRQEEPRKQRRALSPAELDTLLAATKASPRVRFGLSGPERYALYLLACSTGLRANELRQLTAASFDLEVSTVSLPAGKSKNKQAVLLPVEPDVLRQLVLPVTGPVWPHRAAHKSAWWIQGGRMMRHDLKEAGLPVADESGRVFDVHSLRSQFATDLDRAGVSLAMAQKLMRHSTPGLTARHYHRPDAAALAADVAKIKRGKR